MSAVEDVLSRVPLFSNLSGKDRKALAASFRERTFSAGKVVTEAGQEGVGFFVINAGQAEVSVSGRHRRDLGPGDYFGEIALIDGGTRTARVTATTDLECFGLTTWEFRPFVQSHPEVAWALLQSMAQRVRDAEAQLEG